MFDLAAPAFYFPRRLGRVVRRPADPKAPHDRQPSYEAWREGMNRADVLYEPVAEAVLRQQLLAGQAGGAGLTLITGEPGAGKSCLLEDLVVEWASGSPAPYLGTDVPVLVRCRDLDLDDLSLRDANSLADRLWERRAPLTVKAPAAARAFYDRTTGRAWKPLWLVDGLDELPDETLDDDLCRRLAALPGRVCASCRTAVAQAKEGAFRGSLAPSSHIELLPLEDDEQQSFSTAWFAGDAGRAAALCARFRANAQLRELAGSPLLLGLAAEVGEATLPATRASFYAEAVAELWRRRVRPPDRDDLSGQRDDMLTALVGDIRLETIVAPEAVLTRCARTMEPAPELSRLKAALQTSGLLRIRREKVEFLHLTFQEFYLARHLLARSFAEVLEAYWTDPRYEETLSLRLALMLGTESLSEKAVRGVERPPSA